MAASLRLWQTYAWPPNDHLVGPPGPRGGQRALCGVRLRYDRGAESRVNVGNGKLSDRTNICANCRQAAIHLAQ